MRSNLEHLFFRIILACFVLHNIALARKQPDFDDDIEEGELLNAWCLGTTRLNLPLNKMLELEGLALKREEELLKMFLEDTDDTCKCIHEVKYMK